MKLSEAIMLNGMTKPQGHGEKSVASIEAPCAIGGALQVVGKQFTGYPQTKNYDRFSAEWPWTNEYALSGPCPSCRDYNGIAMHVIWHLNDFHGWTRQQIAEWVASIEPQDSSPVTYATESSDVAPNREEIGASSCQVADLKSIGPRGLEESR